jgi:hypothetical protein
MYKKWRHSNGGAFQIVAAVIANPKGEAIQETWRLDCFGLCPRNDAVRLKYHTSIVRRCDNLKCTIQMVALL